jgi:hypothetical protein
MPQVDYIEKLFKAATKPRSQAAIVKGYLHWCYHNEQHMEKMWTLVVEGIRKYDFNKIKPFLLLFQFMLDAKDSAPAQKMRNAWMTEFYTNVIPIYQNIYQMMEVFIDFTIKIGMRIPACKQWFVQNVEAWSYLSDWVKQNSEPPMSYMNQFQQQYSNIRMNKDKHTKLVSNRHDRLKNQVFHFSRKHCLMYLKQEQSNLPDDLLDLTDFKFMRDSQIEYCEDVYPSASSL